MAAAKIGHLVRGVLTAGQCPGLDYEPRVSGGEPGRAGSRGNGASGAKYGIMTSHFYWIGAVPAMLFIGVFMMPFYYGSRARSVPEYLKLRFDEKTRGLNAITFAVMTLFSSGISMYALGQMFKLVLGWSFTARAAFGGDRTGLHVPGWIDSAIYNEVLQFFLIVLGVLPLAILSVRRPGGWSGIPARLPHVMTHAWRTWATPAEPDGRGSLRSGGGAGIRAFVRLLVHGFSGGPARYGGRDSMSAARRTPLLAAFPKM